VNKILKTAAAIGAAFILSSLLAGISPILPLLLNLLSVVVLYSAVSRGETYGAVVGMVCGLLQDSFSLGVFGVAGIAKTLAGYTTGYVAKKINITRFSRRYLFFILVLAMELAIWAFLYAPIFGRRINTGGGLLFFEPLLTGLAAVGAFPLVIRIGRLLEKRRAKK
jgi:rod shape-determining protein MreD